MVGVGGRGEARLSADVRSRSAAGGRRCLGGLGMEDLSAGQGDSWRRVAGGCGALACVVAMVVALCFAPRLLEGAPPVGYYD